MPAPEFGNPPPYHSLAVVMGRLSYFSNTVLKLGRPVSGQAIALAEVDLGCIFSPQHKEFLLTHNGFRLHSTVISGVPEVGQWRHLKRDNLISENTAKRREWAGWPSHWLQLGSDDFGDYFVADLRQADSIGEYLILHADHERAGENDAWNRFADNYFEFLNKVIDGLTERYYRDGQRKN